MYTALTSVNEGIAVDVVAARITKGYEQGATGRLVRGLGVDACHCYSHREYISAASIRPHLIQQLFEEGSLLLGPKCLLILILVTKFAELGAEVSRSCLCSLLYTTVYIIA